MPSPVMLSNVNNPCCGIGRHDAVHTTRWNALGEPSGTDTPLAVHIVTIMLTRIDRNRPYRNKRKSFSAMVLYSAFTTLRRRLLGMSYSMDVMDISAANATL